MEIFKNLNVCMLFRSAQACIINLQTHARISYSFLLEILDKSVQLTKYKVKFVKLLPILNIQN